MSKKILIVEDDLDVINLLRLHIEELGYTLDHATHCDKGLVLALSGDYALFILDIVVPGIGGLELCRKIRAKKPQAAILMLTSKAEELDKVLGLEIGADDYQTKPFSIREVIARIKALLRRSGAEPAEPAAPEKPIILGDLHIDGTRRKVRLKGGEIELTATEFDLIAFLGRNAGRPFTREELLNSVWGYNFSGYEHTVNTTINRLRAKIEKNPAKPRYVVTVWGVGYKLADAAELGARPQ